MDKYTHTFSQSKISPSKSFIPSPLISIGWKILQTVTILSRHKLHRQHNHAQQSSKNKTGCSFNADSEELSTKPHLNPELLTVAASGSFLEEM